MAILLERYGQDPQANQIILMSLVEMGLVRVLPNPDNRGEILLDTRPLQAMLAEYGPRVTTASGRLGVSAAKPEIWTPGATAPGGGGGIWTPGAGPPSAGRRQAPADRPRLVIRPEDVCLQARVSRTFRLRSPSGPRGAGGEVDAGGRTPP